MTQDAHLGEGCAHKACRVKVIYGLDPVFESGTNCIIKVQNPIAYGTNEDSNLAERNMEITKQVSLTVHHIMRTFRYRFKKLKRVQGAYQCIMGFH
jgi:hypothetical protein